MNVEAAHPEYRYENGIRVHWEPEDELSPVEATEPGFIVAKVRAMHPFRVYAQQYVPKGCVRTLPVMFDTSEDAQRWVRLLNKGGSS